MQNPKLYEKSSTVQKFEGEELLKKYSHFLSCESDSSILDVGCGDGFVTTQIIPNYVRFNQLIGIDISKPFVDYAQKHYGNDRIQFEVLDITTENLPECYEARFEQIFSFFCFMWLKDQHRSAVTNLYKMLKPNGKIFLVFAAYHPLYNCYKILSKYDKYAQFMTNVDDAVPIYFQMSDKAEWYRNLLESVGFTVKICDILDKEFCYTLETYKSFLKAINIFKFPAKLEEEYLEDHINEMRRRNFVITRNGISYVDTRHGLFAIIATKK